MIFKTDSNVEIDLAAYGVHLTEESNLFTDSINKSYSLPFSTRLDAALSAKLGLPDIENITNVDTSIKGKLLMPYRYYNATLYLGEIEGNVVEFNLTFGDEDLPVLDMQLSALPWPVVLTPDLVNFANGIISKSWPETAFQFPMVYNPTLKEGGNYKAFKNFTNNYEAGSFIENFTEVVEGENVYNNVNVLAPFPYLLEIIRFGYAQEGKTISGPAVENETIKKALYIPENFLEKFRGSEFETFAFTLPDEVLESEFRAFGVYKRQFTVQNSGTYDLKFDLNLDPITAQYFELTVVQENSVTGAITNLYSARSTNNRVKLEQEIKLNITPEQVFDYIKIELKLNYSSKSIQQFNQFEYSFKDGQLNEFPSYFSLGNFMPDMTFGEYINEVKNWLNLDIVVGDSNVLIDFTQDAVLEKKREKHKHLEIPKPKITHNSNRFYKLSYANGEKVFYNKNGQVYSDLDEKGIDVIEIKMDVQPAVVEQNENILTAVMPEKRSKIDFCVYNGLINGKPTCSPDLIRELFLQNVFLLFWETWLRYRVNSKTFKESFECSVYEILDIEVLSFKYNELHLIKKLDRKINGERMKVDVESETF